MNNFTNTIIKKELKNDKKLGEIEVPEFAFDGSDPFREAAGPI